MNVSTWAYEGTPNYPVEIKKGKESGFTLTCQQIKGKEWNGESEEAVMKAFHLDQQNEYDRLFNDTEPKWMKDVRAGGDIV